MRILPNIQILKNGYRYLNIFLGKERKINRFFAIIFKQRHHLVESKASMTYIRSIMRENYFKMCRFSLNLQILKMVIATLIFFQAKKEKHTGFLLFCLSKWFMLLNKRHHCPTVGPSWEKKYVEIVRFRGFS